MTYIKHLFPVVAIAALASACTVRWGEGDPDRFDDDDDFTSSSASSGSGASTSSSGAGAGGSSSVGSGGSTGVGGGEPTCIDEIGFGDSASICDSLAIAPGNVGLCEDGLPAYGYDVCNRVFEIWNGGHAEYLADCLSAIAPEEACGYDPVTACVAETYDLACESTYINDMCSDWDAQCGTAGELLDVAQCSSDLVTFSDNGLVELTDCMNYTEGSCQERYDACFASVATVQ